MPLYTTDELNSNEFHDDPINWALKKGIKVEYGDVRTLEMHEHNNRFIAGHSYYGMTPLKDTLALDDMEESIIAAKRILVPIIVSIQPDSKGPNGEKIPGKRKSVIGNRRTGGGQKALSRKDLPKDIFDNLTKETPMICLTGLTYQQELILMQDRGDVKDKSAAETLSWLFDLFAEGSKPAEIGRKYWRIFVDLFGNKGKKFEIEQETDILKRKEIIDTWVNGSLTCRLYYGWGLGPIVQKALMGYFMMEDGVKFDEKDKPLFLLKNGQDQMKQLRAARKEDEAAGKWNANIAMEGTAFKACLDKLAKESYAPKTAATGDKPAKMRDMATCKTRQDSFLSNVAKSAIGFAMGGEVKDLPKQDEYAAQQETKRMLVDQYRDRLSDAHKECMNNAFYQTDCTKFAEWLLSTLKPTVNSDKPLPTQDNTAVEAEGVSNAG